MYERRNRLTLLLRVSDSCPSGIPPSGTITSVIWLVWFRTPLGRVIWVWCLSRCHGGLSRLICPTDHLYFTCFSFQVVNPRAALLSNFEVLSLLRGLEADHLSRTKTAFRIKKEEEASAVPSSFTIPGNISHLEASENLRTVQVEVCRVLFLNNISVITFMVSGNQLSLRKLPTKHISERRRHHETCQRPRTLRFNKGRKTSNRQLGSNSSSGIVCCVCYLKNSSVWDVVNRVHR